MGGRGERPDHPVHQGRVRPGVQPGHRPRSRAAGRALYAARRQEPRAVAEPAERPGAAGPAGALAAVLDRAGDWGTAADLRRRAVAAGVVDLHVHSTASDGSLPPEAVVERAPGRRASRPWRSPTTTPSPACRPPSRPASASGSGWWAAASSARPRPGARCTCWATSCRPHSAELERFLERCRADRVRRAREMVTRLQRLGVGSTSMTCCCSRRAARWAGRTSRAPSSGRAGPSTSRDAFDRFIGRGRPAFVDKVLPDVPRDRRPGARGRAAWSRSRISRSGAPARSSSGSSARASTRSRPAIRATIPTCARGSPTSRSGSDCSGPAAATGTATPSPARPTAPSAPSRCRSSGSTGWMHAPGRTPRARRLHDACCRRAAAAPDFTATARTAGRTRCTTCSRESARAAGVLSRERHPRLKPPTLRRARRHRPSTSASTSPALRGQSGVRGEPCRLCRPAGSAVPAALRSRSRRSPGLSER